MWKVLSEDGLLKDPPLFTDEFNYKHDVNLIGYSGKLETEEQAYENFQRVNDETHDWKMNHFDFVLVKIVTL